MRYIVFVFVCMFGFFQSALAQEKELTFEGELYSKQFTAKAPGGDKLLEFIREDESFEKWTRLIGFRYQQLPGAKNDPRIIAAAVARNVEKSTPGAKAMVSVSKDGSEAMVDFLTWPKGGGILEFNVFRYARSTDGKAVVSLQLAHRFTDISVDDFKKIRAAWLTEAASFDMNFVRQKLSGL